MPELPEVEITVRGLQKKVVGLTIHEVWTDYRSVFYFKKQSIKNPRYFTKFSDFVTGTKIGGVSRIGKNILIHLNNEKTIAIHMKMTGHLLFGKYVKEKNKWIPPINSPLSDPYNRFVHFAINFNNGNSLVLSDARKFASVRLIDTDQLSKDQYIGTLGPDPNSKHFSPDLFIKQIGLKPKGKIKQVLMDQN